jgi:hypothetical protein
MYSSCIMPVIERLFVMMMMMMMMKWWHIRRKDVP